MQLWKSQRVQQASGCGRTLSCSSRSSRLVISPRAAGAAAAATDKETVLPRDVESMVQQAAAAVQRSVQGAGGRGLTSSAQHCKAGRVLLDRQVQGWDEPLADSTTALLDPRSRHSETQVPTSTPTSKERTTVSAAAPAAAPVGAAAAAICSPIPLQGPVWCWLCPAAAAAPEPCE